MNCEIHHNISKEASNDLFEISKKWFHKLMIAKDEEGIAKNVPQFVHLRRLLYNKNVPEVKMDVSYLNKETGESLLLEDLEKMPRASEYPPTKFIKQFEVATVKVILSIFVLPKIMFSNKQFRRKNQHAT